jgi:hypothetical protein
VGTGAVPMGAARTGVGPAGMVRGWDRVSRRLRRGRVRDPDRGNPRTGRAGRGKARRRDRGSSSARGRVRIHGRGPARTKGQGSGVVDEDRGRVFDRVRGRWISGPGLDRDRASVKGRGSIPAARPAALRPA